MPVTAVDNPHLDTPQHGLPVTIITGFLGSGKTTLLNHILSNQNGIRTAVLVNEFGEISIDSELIVSSEEDMVELNNGCICCTVREDIAESVFRILERPQKIDYLVVETTGLADPLPVALTFLGPDLKELTRLDSIITLVDASNFAPDLFESDVAYSQIAYGDMIVLNKSDLVSEGELKRLEKRIYEIKGDARILRATKSNVPLELILDTALFHTDMLPPLAPASSQDHPDHPDHADHDDHQHHDHHHDHHDHSHCDHAHGDPHHHHDTHNHLEVDGFNSVAFTSDRPLNLDKFQIFLNHLPAAIFRAKGILWFNESPEKYIFHLSGKRYTLDSEPWTTPPKNQLVLIGQKLDVHAIKKQLEACVQPLPQKGFGKR